MVTLLFLLMAAMPIHDARKAARDAEVTVQGAVTVMPNTFRSSTSDSGFAIQDSTGGIYVSTQETHKLKPLEQVRVTGWIQDDGHGLLILKPTLVEKRKGPLVAIPTKHVRTGDVGRSTQGWLITVQGVINRIRHDAPYGIRVFINDGSGDVQVFIHQSALIGDLNLFQVGTRIGVTGFSGQYDALAEVCPRSAADIRENPPRVR